MAPDATTVVVGLDIGTTGVQAIAVGPDGPIVARAACHPLKGDTYYMGGFDLCTIPNL